MPVKGLEEKQTGGVFFRHKQAGNKTSPDDNERYGDAGYCIFSSFKMFWAFENLSRTKSTYLASTLIVRLSGSWKT